MELGNRGKKYNSVRDRLQVRRALRGIILKEKFQDVFNCRPVGLNGGS